MREEIEWSIATGAPTTAVYLAVHDALVQYGVDPESVMVDGMDGRNINVQDGTFTYKLVNNSSITITGEK